MSEGEAVWARRKDTPEYHRVVFSPGPKMNMENSACGLLARFWPRLGIRMDDQYCPICVEKAAEAGPDDH